MRHEYQMSKGLKLSAVSFQPSAVSCQLSYNRTPRFLDGGKLIADS